MYRTQSEGSGTVPGTAADRDVDISVAQAAIVICVFCCCLYLDCVPKWTPLFHMFFSAGSMSGAAPSTIHSGKNLTLKLKYGSDVSIEICLWILEMETTNWHIQ